MRELINPAEKPKTEYCWCHTVSIHYTHPTVWIWKKVTTKVRWWWWWWWWKKNVRRSFAVACHRHHSSTSNLYLETLLSKHIHPHLPNAFLLSNTSCYELDMFCLQFSVNTNISKYRTHTNSWIDVLNCTYGSVRKSTLGEHKNDTPITEANKPNITFHSR